MSSTTSSTPDPTPGLIIYDIAYDTQRWRVRGVAIDDRIEAVRIVPDDGTRHSWDRKAWERAWDSGWLLVDEEASHVAPR